MKNEDRWQIQKPIGSISLKNTIFRLGIKRKANNHYVCKIRIAYDERITIVLRATNQTPKILITGDKEKATS